MMSSCIDRATQFGKRWSTKGDSFWKFESLLKNSLPLKAGGPQCTSWPDHIHIAPRLRRCTEFPPVRCSSVDLNAWGLSSVHFIEGTTIPLRRLQVSNKFSWVPVSRRWRAISIATYNSRKNSALDDSGICHTFYLVSFEISVNS